MFPSRLGYRTALGPGKPGEAEGQIHCLGCMGAVCVAEPWELPDGGTLVSRESHTHCTTRLRVPSQAEPRVWSSGILVSEWCLPWKACPVLNP